MFQVDKTFQVQLIPPIKTAVHQRTKQQFMYFPVEKARIARGFNKFLVWLKISILAV